MNTQQKLITNSLIQNRFFLLHDVFNNHHSETSLMRYIKRLERNLSLTHSMIALGSCTMKLNAASEMLPLSMPYWNSIHPFAPLDQVKGYTTMLKS
jgi:glycine dehydrogenase